MLLALVGLVLALAQVWTRLQIVAVGYALSNTRQLLHTLEGERQALEGEWRARTAPGRLGEQARQRLHLDVPLPEQVIRLP
jgi:cell division protein FtsL